MSLFHNSAIVGSSGQGGYLINQSLRFNSADSAYLNRTPASEGNRKTWTWSGWVKYTVKNNTSTYNQPLFWASSTATTGISFSQDPNTAHRIYVYNAGWNIETTQFFRDPSSWYHIVAVIDTTQATASNRTKLYINGVQVTDLATASYPAQNTGGDINNTTEHNIGKQIGLSRYLDAYLAEVNFIDGTALTPSSFGETDTITGAWIPKKYSGSYGTNGFYLKFQSSGIGTDSSGNGNTWTANNFSTSGTGTDVMSDTPTNNWCTLNPLNQDSAFTLSDGNLKLTSTANTSSVGVTSTSAVYSGKWYWEITRNSWNINCGISLITTSSPRSSAVTGSGGQGVSYLGTNIYKDGSSVQSGLSNMVDGDVAGIALNLDSNTVQFYRNGSALGTAVSISAGTWTPSFGMDTGGYAANVTTTFNFGQRAFAYTPPTGYKALNTANLPEPTIKKGSTYFNTVTYSGSSSNQAITVGFEPDFLWIKRRNGANDHNLYNAIVGLTGNYLVSNSTGAENSNNNRIVATSSTGFTVGTGSADTNGSGNTYVAWAWDANGAGSSNTAGTITSTVSANTTAGFSIVTWTGTGADGSYGHGLGVQPAMIIHKRRDSTSDWHVWHKGLPTKNPTYDVIYLNLINAQNSGNNNLFRLDPTSTLIYTGSAGSHNVNGATYVDYVFSEVAGYSKFGSYIGNGSTDGTFVYCGFKPAFVLVKRTDGNNTWTLWDNERPAYNEAYYSLIPNTADQEQPNEACDLLSNGFKLRRTPSYYNGSGNSYIFAAFAEHPFKYANAR